MAGGLGTAVDGLTVLSRRPPFGGPYEHKVFRKALPCWCLAIGESQNFQLPSFRRTTTGVAMGR